MIAQAVNLMNFLKGPKQFIAEEDGGKSCSVYFPQETRPDPSDFITGELKNKFDSREK